MASNRVPPGTHCADPPSTNRSLPVLESVCECRKRNLKKGDQRRAAETYRLGAASSPFVRQETSVTGPNLRKCRGSYTASPETILARFHSLWAEPRRCVPKVRGLRRENLAWC